MLTSFFCKKNDWFFCVILFHIFLQENILRNNFICFYFSMVRSRPWLDSVKRDSNGFFLKKWGWDHNRIKRVSINLASSEVSTRMHECMQYFSFLIFLIFFILAFKKKCIWVHWECMDIYTESYDDLWECM